MKGLVDAGKVLVVCLFCFVGFFFFLNHKSNVELLQIFLGGGMKYLNY